MSDKSPRMQTPVVSPSRVDMVDHFVPVHTVRRYWALMLAGLVFAALAIITMTVGIVELVKDREPRHITGCSVPLPCSDAGSYCWANAATVTIVFDTPLTRSFNNVCAIQKFSGKRLTKLRDGDSRNRVQVLHDVTLLECQQRSVNESEPLTTSVQSTVKFGCFFNEDRGASSLDMDPYLQRNEHDRLVLILVSIIFAALVLLSLLFFYPLWLILLERFKYFVFGLGGDKPVGFCVRAYRDWPWDRLLFVAVLFFPIMAFLVLGYFCRAIIRVCVAPSVRRDARALPRLSTLEVVHSPGVPARVCTCAGARRRFQRAVELSC